MRKTSVGHSPPRGRPPRRRRGLSLAVLSAACVLFAWVLISDDRTSALTNAPAASLPNAAPPDPQGPDFSRFTHANPQHARLPCLLCHTREDNSPRPRRPGHTPCSGCHTQQFADQSNPICTVCHTSPGSAAVKPFPPLRTFNVLFDHARHTRGGAAPRQSCAACHRPTQRGVALSIPRGTSAHTTCFQCHTPRAQAGGRDINSCSTCHRLGRYSRTPETAAAYRVNFSHASHTSKGLSCAECHRVRAGAPQRRQVSSPSPLMHHASKNAQSCMSCHDDRRAFGGDDFKDCTRCHRGGAWHF
ncbi:MAG TPA: cytochrome c3 family protein [Pyrinomonadaceae bacterium]|nr:cytochrome c3 family protein [Pyrinomonadaceae bacterium]